MAKTFMRKKEGFTPYINFDRFFGCPKSTDETNQRDLKKVHLSSDENVNSRRSCIMGFTPLEIYKVFKIWLKNLLSLLISPKSFRSASLTEFTPLEIFKSTWSEKQTRRKSASPYCFPNKKALFGSLTGFTPLEIYKVFKIWLKNLLSLLISPKSFRSASLTGFTLI